MGRVFTAGMVLQVTLSRSVNEAINLSGAAEVIISSISPGLPRQTPADRGFLRTGMSVAQWANEISLCSLVLFTDTNYLAAKRMLDVTVLRHEAIASNWRTSRFPTTSDLMFLQRLEDAIATSRGEQEPRRVDVGPEWPVDNQATSGRSDGNTVQLETELMKAFNQNMVEHALETQLVTNSLMKMRLAITGKS